MIIAPLVKGFLMGAGLIIAIGAQNAFILKQGLKRRHLFLTAFTCFVLDSILIVLGVKGIGFAMDNIPSLEDILRWGGAIFLAVYGLRSFISAFRPQALVAELEQPRKNDRMATLAALFAFSLLNPHTYVDTFLILGNVGAQHPMDEHLPFILGALGASFLWFFSLTYGASTLSPLFRNPRAWQVLDTTMGFVMLGIAYTLVI